MAHQAFTTGFAQIAQLVEQGTENPCVLGSTPSLGTILDPDIVQDLFYSNSDSFINNYLILSKLYFPDLLFKAVKVWLNTCKESFTYNSSMPRMTISINHGKYMLFATAIIMR